VHRIERRREIGRKKKMEKDRKGKRNARRRRKARRLITMQQSYDYIVSHGAVDVLVVGVVVHS